MKVGFTGTRKGMTPEQISKVTAILKYHGASEFHHGDCVGADAEAHLVAVGLGVPVHIHPPINESGRAFCTGYEKVSNSKPYLDRNKDIVEACELLIAAPDGLQEKVRSGTWSTVRYARERKRVLIVFYTGEVVEG